MILELPFPPSSNTYYRKVGSKMLISAKGRDYKIAVRKAVLQYLAQNDREALKNLQEEPAFSGRPDLAVEIHLHLPTKGRHDVDNYQKGLLDALTDAQVWYDDDQVFELVTKKFRKDSDGGRCVVKIREIEP